MTTLTTSYLLNKASYAQWFQYQFHEKPPNEIMASGVILVLAIERTSKLTTAEEEVVHVKTVEGSTGVPLGMSFAVAKRCLKNRGE